MSIATEIERIKKAKESIINTLKANDIQIEETASIDEVDMIMNDVPILDTSDATATAEDILKDKTAYVNGEKVTGALEVSTDTNNCNAVINTTMARNFYETAGLADYITELYGYLKAPVNSTSLFINCTNLMFIEQLDTTGTKSMKKMFYGCTNLKNIPDIDMGTASNLENWFYNCESLTDDDLNKIMNLCVNATSYTGTKTLTYIGLGSYVNKCQTLSNYQAFVDAGWSAS